MLTRDLTPIFHPVVTRDWYVFELHLFASTSPDNRERLQLHQPWIDQHHLLASSYMCHGNVPAPARKSLVWSAFSGQGQLIEIHAKRGLYRRKQNEIVQ